MRAAAQNPQMARLVGAAFDWMWRWVGGLADSVGAVGAAWWANIVYLVPT